MSPELTRHVAGWRAAVAAARSLDSAERARIGKDNRAYQAKRNEAARIVEYVKAQKKAGRTVSAAWAEAHARTAEARRKLGSAQRKNRRAA
jgi:hypothetical protein